MLRRISAFLLLTILLGNSPYLPAQAATGQSSLTDSMRAVAPLPAASSQPQIVPDSSAPPSPQTPPTSTAAQAQIPTALQAPQGVQIITLPNNTLPQYDLMWRYQGGTWSSFAPPLPAAQWKAIVSDPFDSQRWLVLAKDEYGEYYNTNGFIRRYDGRDPLWLTTDGGTTWQVVLLPVPTTEYNWHIDWQGFAFDTTTPGTWRLSISSHVTNKTYLYRGSLADAGTPVLVDDASNCYKELVHLGAGVDGDTLLYSYTGTSCGSTWQRRGLSYVPSDSNTNIISGASLFGGTSPDAPLLSIYERLSGTSRTVVGINNINGSYLDLYATSDYRTTQVSLRLNAVGAFLTAAQDSVFIGGRTGILQIPDVIGAPQTNSVVAGTETTAIGRIRADRQTRRAVAAISENKQTFFVRSSPNGTWQTISVPSGASMSGLFEVLPGRGAFPADQELCPECVVSHLVHAVVGGPIDTRTGNLWTSGLDLSVTTPGPAITWERSYASQATATDSASLGYGWTHTYASRLITETMTGGEAGRVIVVSPKGNHWRYDDLGSGFRPWPGVPGTLIRAGDSYTQTLSNRQQMVFDAASGRLRAMRDSVGRTVELTYDATSGLLTHIEDTGDSSRFLDISYDTNNRIQRVEDPTGRAVTYTYSSAGDLETVSDVMQRVTTYHYQNHLLTEIVNALNQVVEQTTYDTYTPTGRAIEQVLLTGEQLQLNYQSSSTMVTTTGADGQVQVATYAYTSDDVLTDISVAGETVLATAANANFLPGATSDGNGNVTTTTYSSLGLPQSRTNALGQATQVTYDSNNRPVSTIDWQGIESRWRYDSQGNVISSTVGITTSIPLGYTTLYTYTYDVRYTGDSQLAEQATPDGVRTAYAYDSQGQVISSTVGYATALAQTTGYQYDSQGRVVTTTLGLGTALERRDVTRYNADNSISATIQNYQDGVFDSAAPDQDVITSFGYDGLGRQIWVRDVLGHYQVTRYTTTGQVAATARNVVPLQLDTQGQPLIPAFDASAPDQNVATLYAYDGLGRTTLVTETGILAGTFDPLTLTFSDQTTRVTRTEYDAFSRPVTVTLNYRPGLPATADTNVQTLTYYDGAGNIIWQRDAYGRWTKTEYDALNRPTRTIQNYEDGDPLSGARDADLIQDTYYTSAGQVERQIDNVVDSVFSVTEPITDRVALMQYDALGRLTSTTQNFAAGQSDAALNRTRLTAYDAVTGRVQGSRDVLGRWTSQQYDALGRVTSTIQNCRDGSGSAVATDCASFSSSTPDRNVTTATHYDVLGHAFETVDPLGVATRTLFDDLGRVTSTIAAYDDGIFNASTPDTDVTTQMAYDALGRVISSTDPTGAVTYQAYNGLGATTVVTDSVGRATQQGFDGQGALRWTRSPDGRLTVFTLDGLGRTITTITNYQDGTVSAQEPADQDLVTQTVYDIAGRHVQDIDTAGRVTQFAYDNLDRLIAVTENLATGTCSLAPCNVVTQYQYDRAGNRTAIIDANGHVRRFTYDAANQQIEAIDALNQTTGYSYDAAGRLIGTTDPRGSSNNLTYSYDDLDRQTGVSASNLGSIGQTYDARGQRLSMVDATGSTTFQYDQLGRVTSLSAPNTGTVGYGYDAAGMRTRLTYPDGTEITYAYDTGHQLQAVHQGTTDLATYTYDTVGRLATVARANSAVTTYGYDGADRLRTLDTTIGTSTVSQFQYTLDRAGLRTEVKEVLPQSAPSETPTPTATATATPTATATATIAATSTPTATPTATSAATNTPTATTTATNSPTATPVATNTPTATPSSGATFYRAINLNGTAQTIDGNAWEGSDATNYTYSGSSFCDQSVTLTPSTDTARTTMIRCSIWDNTPYVHLQSVPSGTYQVYLYVWEDNNSETFDIYFEGTLVENDYVSGSAGHWEKLGPWTATITDGTLAVDTIGGHANLSGIEVWQVSTGPTATPTVTATPTATSAATNTPTPTAAVPNTPTPTPSSGVAFYRAINLNGTAQTIDGNAWEGSDATNYTYSGSSFCNQNVALSPSTDTTRATMIRCSIWDNTPYVHLQSVPSGTYQVSLYVWEDNNSEMFDIYFEGTLVENDYVSGSAGHWEKLGPWTATVTDGTIAVDTIGGHANLSGIEVWQVSSGATNTPTPTSAGTTSTPTPTATSTPTGTPTSSGLVAAYNFDAGSGTSLADVTGNGHTGTLVNGPSWTTQGRYGDALSFDGENDLVSIADANDLDLTTDMTLEVWVYPTEDLQGWRSVLLKGQSVDLVYAIYANSDGDVPSGWVYIDGEKVATGTDALATNTWTHLATTFDGSTIRFYVNGTQVGSTSVSGSITVSDEALELGGDTVWAEFFTGRLDDVRIYNRALSATEIQSDMNTAVSGSSSLSQETVRAVAPSTNQASSQTTATKTQVPNDYPATRVHERAVQPHTESAFSESRFSLSSTSWMKVAPPDLPNSLTLNTILPQTAPLTTTRTITYTYDGLQRLTGAFESPGSSYAYTYDLAGNRIGVWANGVQTQNLSYNAANQVTGWTYDAAGNLLSDGTSTYAYDAPGRVITLNGSTNSYNGDGVLVAQTSGSTTTTYAQDLAAPLSQILNDGTNRYIYGNGPERLFGVAGSTRTWYSTDALGTVRATLDDSGTVLASANYDPWGVPETGAIAPFGFNGELQQENDVYLRARWYQASAGSFVSRDSFEGISKRPYSLMPYQYAYAVPTVWADPSGAYACTLPTQYRTPAAIEYTQKYVAFCNEQRTRLDLSRKSGNLHAIRAIDALLYFFTDPYLPGGTSRQALQLHQARLSFAAERLEFVLWHAESGPFKEFRDEAVKFSSDPSSNTFDEGFAVELRDSQIWASSSRQVGHFLSAVAAGYSIIDESIAISCLVGHELVGDERFPYVNNAAQCLAGQYSIEAFQTAVRADASDDIALRDCVVANIVGLPELPNGKSGYDDPRFKDRVGNSRQDLRLTIKGWRLGRAIRDKQITLLSQITSWIYEEIHE